MTGRVCPQPRRLEKPPGGVRVQWGCRRWESKSGADGAVELCAGDHSPDVEGTPGRAGRGPRGAGGVGGHRARLRAEAQPGAEGPAPLSLQAGGTAALRAPRPPRPPALLAAAPPCAAERPPGPRLPACLSAPGRVGVKTSPGGWAPAGPGPPVPVARGRHAPPPPPLKPVSRSPAALAVSTQGRGGGEAVRASGRHAQRHAKGISHSAASPRGLSSVQPDPRPSVRNSGAPHFSPRPCRSGGPFSRPPLQVLWCP